ncbi:MAG: hypothetical protein KF760_15015 [Candidatus Eremiobacteraeota bacterium]|nr:hypothetical protein [Candidatus Eremiobacteraeota bacterium]MCW5866350.1 hypothetical protein [Candidatus Eremiobacteraeota bacterium]
MAYVKLNISLEQEVASLLRRRASESGKPLSQYLKQLIIESELRQQQSLAEEGYRLLAAESQKFAESASELAQEVWSDW